jgi:catechol 2,3-dioxygenase-like lactoylglutathione lyase family enzyme
MRIDRLDHLVLTVADVGATVDFYTRVLGMEAMRFVPGLRPHQDQPASGRSRVRAQG